MSDGNKPDGDMAEKPDHAVPYERFRQVNETAKALKAELEAAQAKIAEIAAAQARYEAEMAARTQERDAAILDAARVRAAVLAGLPLDLAGRLQGKDAEELQSDAARLAAYVRPAPAPAGVPPTPVGQPAPVLDLSKMTPEEIRAHASKVWSAVLK